MHEDIDHRRRRSWHRGSVTVAAAQFGMTGFASAQAVETKPAAVLTSKAELRTSFGPLKQINAGRSQCRIRRSRARRRSRGDSSARLAL